MKKCILIILGWLCLRMIIKKSWTIELKDILLSILFGGLYYVLTEYVYTRVKKHFNSPTHKNQIKE